MVLVNYPPPSEWVVRNARPRKDHAAAAAALQTARLCVNWARTERWLRDRAKPRPEATPTEQYCGRFRNAKVLKGAQLTTYWKRNPAPKPSVKLPKSRTLKKTLRQLLPRLKKLAVPRKHIPKKLKPAWPKPGVLTHTPSAHLIGLAQPRCTTYCPPKRTRRPISKSGLARLFDMAEARAVTPRFQPPCTMYTSLPNNLLHFEPSKRLIRLSEPRVKRNKYAAVESAIAAQCLCPQDYVATERTLQLAEPRVGAPAYTNRQKPPLPELNCAKCVDDCLCTFKPNERTLRLAVPKGDVPKKPALPTLDCNKCVVGCVCTFVLSERTAALAEPRARVVPYGSRPPEPQWPTQAALNYEASDRIVELAKPTDRIMELAKPARFRCVN